MGRINYKGTDGSQGCDDLYKCAFSGAGAFGVGAFRVGFGVLLIPGLDQQAAANVPHPVLHIGKTIAKGADLRPVEAYAIILDNNGEFPACVHGKADAAGLCMFDNIMQGFFYGEEDVPAKLAADKEDGEILGGLDGTADAGLQ